MAQRPADVPIRQSASGAAEPQNPDAFRRPYRGMRDAAGGARRARGGGAALEILLSAERLSAELAAPAMMLPNVTREKVHHAKRIPLSRE
ncbi:hypothetical protein [Sorangium cellulosum]|uniref:hypothetical protein n=1 Tax=Sorangium cellulosum TaxID=56 RepID=UPI001A919596|nr:hypothetical protein [Sorangium cellulosum]